jgi:transcription initiation factor IIE alpha subunit
MDNWIEFIPHCDEDCGLGSAWYMCPHCHERGVDYDLWIESEDKYTEDLPFKCENCNTDLVAEYQISEGAYEVKIC